MLILYSDGSGNFAGAQAAGAYVYGLGSAVDDRLYASDVGFPGAVGLAIGVRDGETELDRFSADFTFCHYFYLLKPRVIWRATKRLHD